MALQLVNDKEFEREVLRAELPVLVDLYADWCQPCKQIEPILIQLSSELAGKIKFVRVNVDHSPMVARAFRVQSIPMLVLLQGGRPVDQLMGAVDKKAIQQMLQPFMPQAPDEVPPQDLAALVKTGQAIAVDIRDASAYGRYRIPGALNVPAEQVLERKAELAPTDGRVRVLYGRGSDEAKELAAKVREGGVPVAFLAGGFLHWEAEGLEVERGG
jgi:thioredoxin 1/putative thioredoxin